MIRTKLTAMQRIPLTSDMDQADVLKTVLKADMQNIRAPSIRGQYCLQGVWTPC